jgi:hypothetical protein
MALKATIALVVALLLLSNSVILFSKRRSTPALLQFLGAGCLVVVALAHICEAFGLFPWTGWGLPYSVGHYLDLVSASLGLTLFPIGYLWRTLTG